MIKEDGTVGFDEAEQKEVDRIIQERLSRVKAEKPADYDDLSEIAKELEEFGYSGTPAEKKAAIKVEKAERAAQKELEELEAQSRIEGTSPAILKEIQDAKKAAKEANDKLAKIEAKENEKNAEDEKVKKDSEAWQAQIREFNGEYPDITVEELEKNEQFIDFVSGSGWSLKQAYAKYVKVYGEIESDTIKKVSSKELRSTSGGKGSGSGGGTSLTAEQKQTVDDWNRKNPKMQMSYKEFAEKQ